ncbi:MAG TPA: hypothetical protein VGY55_25020 [Pirellulales bacterium]|nr:hypothetical protein [Pirellulales bacterium]
MTPEQTRQFAEIQGDAGLADRLADLADKANEGELLAAERAEYEAYIEADNLLAVLRAEARFYLAHCEP